MKKIILFVSILSVIFLCACTFVDYDDQLNNNDWSYELPNDYVLWHINSRKIICGKKNTKNSITNIVGDYIIKFCYNDQYVCLQCVDVPKDLLIDIDKSNPQFYIIDTLNEDVEGPFTESEYEEKISCLKVDNLSTWMLTKPKPDGAIIP